MTEHKREREREREREGYRGRLIYRKSRNEKKVRSDRAGKRERKREREREIELDRDRDRERGGEATRDRESDCIKGNKVKKKERDKLARV